MTRRTKKHTKRHRRKRGGAWLDPTTWSIFQRKTPQTPTEAAIAAEEALPSSVDAKAQADALGVAPGGEVNMPGPSSEQVLGTGGRRRRRRRTQRR